MWVLPTRSRPLEAIRAIRSLGDSPIFMMVWNEDPHVHAYKLAEWPSNVEVYYGPQESVQAKLNWFFHNYPDERFYGFLADDIVLKKGCLGFLEDLAHKDNISYPDDSVWGEDLCTHPCIGGDLVRKMGWWCYPEITHNFFDTFWWVIGEFQEKLRYVPEVVYDHIHPVTGRVPRDEVYLKGSESKAQDIITFNTWKDGYIDCLRSQGCEIIEGTPEVKRY